MGWGTWTRLTGEGDELTPYSLVVDGAGFHVATRQAWPQEVQLVVALAGVDEMGRPGPAELQHHADVEERLADWLSGMGEVMGTVTGDGVRVTVVETDDAASLTASQPRLAAEYDRRVEVLVGRGWEFFDEVLTPRGVAERQLMDSNAALADLLGASLRASDDAAVEHRLLGERETCEPLARVFAADGFATQLLDSDDGCWLTMRRTDVLAEVPELSALLAEFVESRGVDYDGWRLVPDAPAPEPGGGQPPPASTDSPEGGIHP